MVESIPIKNISSITVDHTPTHSHAPIPTTPLPPPLPFPIPPSVHVYHSELSYSLRW